MKKIVAILAAALTMTASIFAADVAAAVQGYGDLGYVKLDNGTTTYGVLGWNDPWDREFNWYSTGIGFSFNGDRAGLSFELDNRDVTVKKSKFWIQPADMVKIQLGDNCIEMSKETIDYAGTVFSNGYEGWYVAITPAEGVTAEIGLKTNAPSDWSTNYWIGTKNYDGGNSIGEVTTSVAYAADFGTIKAIYDYVDKENTIALDFAGNFGGVAVSPAVAFKVAAKALAADLYVQANAAGVGINVYTKADVPVSDASATAVAVNTKFTYGISLGQLSLQVKDDNVLGDFAIMTKLNLGYSCGSAGLDTGIQLDYAGSVKVSVPFDYNIHF